MTKLNSEQILEIQKLRKEGRTQFEIAVQFKVSISAIQYHTNEKQKANQIESSKRWFKNLNKSQRKELYNKRKEYWRNYTRNRYNTDEEYRKRVIRYQMEYKKRKKNDKSKSFG